MLPQQRNPCIDCNLINSAQLGGIPYHSPKLHPGPYNTVGMRPWTDRQTHTQTDVRNQIHFASYTTHAKCNRCSIVATTAAEEHGTYCWQTMPEQTSHRRATSLLTRLLSYKTACTLLHSAPDLDLTCVPEQHNAQYRCLYTA